MTIRLARQDDAPALAQLDALCFPDAWNLASLREAVGEPNGRNFAVLAERNGEIIGYGAAWTLWDEGEITRVCVLPAHQARGVGAELTRALLRACASRGAKAVFLEVRQSNAVAQRLYAKIGFAPCGLRRNYYSNGETAIIMRVRL